MHPYSIDVKRNKIIFYCAILAIVLATSVSHWLSDIPYIHVVIPVTSLTIFLLVMRVMEHMFWKSPFLRKMGAIRTPIIQGVWVGFITNEQTGEQQPVEMRVKQSWMNMQVTWLVGEREWKSTVAAFQLSGPLGTLFQSTYSVFDVREQMPVLLFDGSIRLIVHDDHLRGVWFMHRSDAVESGTMEVHPVKDPTVTVSN